MLRRASSCPGERERVTNTPHDGFKKNSIFFFVSRRSLLPLETSTKEIHRKRPIMSTESETVIEERRVLSIQSHTCHGYVGNKAAVFPLQLHGFDVDFINAVQFSNHTGYASWTGQKLNGDELISLMDGLDSNGLLEYSHLLTGYAGSASFLRAIVKVAKRLKDRSPSLLYFCDPVMGDNGKLYVPEELVGIYKDEVLGIADVLLPNSFELEMLTGIKIKSESDALRACGVLHDKGPSVIVITSVSFENEKDDDSITMLISLKRQSEKVSSRQRAHKIRVPRIEGYFTGTGDLTAALMLVWLSRDGEVSPSRALELTAASIQAVLRRTNAYASKRLLKPKGRRLSHTVPPELRLIQSHDDLISPPEISSKAIELL